MKQLFFYCINHRRWTTHIKVLIDNTAICFEKILSDLPVCISFHFFIRQNVDEITAQNIFKFLCKDYIIFSFIGKDELVITYFIFWLKIPEEANKRSNSCAPGNKYT